MIAVANQTSQTVLENSNMYDEHKQYNNERSTDGIIT